MMGETSTSAATIIGSFVSPLKSLANIGQKHKHQSWTDGDGVLPQSPAQSTVLFSSGGRGRGREDTINHKCTSFSTWVNFGSGAHDAFVSCRCSEHLYTSADWTVFPVGVFMFGFKQNFCMNIQERGYSPSQVGVGWCLTA